MSEKWHQAADAWHNALQPGAIISYERDGKVWTETVQSVRYESAQPEIRQHLTRWQQILRMVTPRRWRKPIAVVRPYQPETVSFTTDRADDALARAQAKIAEMSTAVDRLTAI